jgi:hypothetical protein
MVPESDFLSAPLWLVTVLHIVTLTLHFAAMNFMFGGLIIILWGKFTDRWNNPVVQKFIRFFPAAMAATITFGVAPLLFVQLVYHRQIYSASIISGWFWLLVVPVLVVTYYLLYSASFNSDKPDNHYKWKLHLAFVGMLYVSYIFSSVFSMAERPDLMKALYAERQDGLVLNPELGDYIVRWLHMLSGAITVGGFFVGFVGRKNEEAYKIGKLFFLWGMVIASVLGFIYLVTLGENILPLMRSPAIWALTFGIILSAGSLHFFFKKKFLFSALMVGVSLITMVYTRHELRLIRLVEHYDPSTMTVNPQWSVFALFIACFVIMLGMLWYMFRLFSVRKQPAA